MKSAKVSIPPSDKVLQLALLLDTKQELGVFVLPDLPLDSHDAHTSDIDIPPIDVVALGYTMHYTSLNSVAVHNLNL